MRRRWLAMLLVILLTTGCWSAHEINDLAIVLSIGTDITPAGHYIVTAMIASPVPAGQGGEGGSSGGLSGSWVLSAEGDTIFKATRNLSALVPRRLFWAHADTLVIGRRLAEHGIVDVLDLTRDPQPRRTMRLLVTEGEAAEVLRMKAVLEPSLSRELDGLIRNREMHEFTAGQDLNHYLRDHSAGRKAPVVALLRATQDPASPGDQAPAHRVSLTGATIFWRDKLVGILSDEETRGTLWLRGELKGGAMTVACPGHSQGAIVVKLAPSTTSLSAGIQGTKLWGDVMIRAEGSIGEVTCPLRSLSLHTVDEIQAAFSDGVKAEVTAALQKAQKELGVDPFGFGDAIFRTNPGGWSRIAGQWPAAFRTMSIRVSVDAHLTGSGLTGITPEQRR